MKKITCGLLLAVVILTGCGNAGSMPVEENNDMMISIKVNGTELAAQLADNSSAKAFAELLESGDLTIEMSDYGSFEKVGDLGKSLPTNDERITTEPGDIILYQGDKITIYYDTNSWTFTRLGKILTDGLGGTLKDVLGKGDVTVTFSLAGK